MDRKTRWQRNIAALEQYAAREGHTRVPNSHVEAVLGSPVALGNWVAHQRHRHNKGLLSPAQEEELAGLPGWAWGPLRRGSRPKADRNTLVRKMAADGLSLQQIGDKFLISRQRVHQIIKDERKQCA